MLNFCTLFDSNYLIKGLCMYDSLKYVCVDFHLYIFAFDEKSDSILRNMQLDYVTVISLSEFEDPELLEVKGTRGKGEYCWTCTSSTILYCIQKFQLDSCTYLDADLFFYNDPKVLIDEMGDKDVLITSHRYTPEYDLSATCGKYCVQFVTFKNTKNGLNVLNWWRNACLNWCYARYEDGKFGDQMYLDDWPTRFEGIHELEHLGGGVAPWNMQQYKFYKTNQYWRGIELATKQEFELIFFHFHAIHSYHMGFMKIFYFEGYSLSQAIKRDIYLPYITQLLRTNKQLNSKDRYSNGLASRNIKVWTVIKAFGLRILKNDFNYTFWIK